MCETRDTSQVTDLYKVGKLLKQVKPIFLSGYKNTMVLTFREVLSVKILLKSDCNDHTKGMDQESLVRVTRRQPSFRYDSVCQVRIWCSMTSEEFVLGSG